jgi:uncharacterized protein (TIGR02466 family)
MIHTWFPKSVYIEENICIDQLPHFEKKIKEIFKEKEVFRGSMQNVETIHPTYPWLHTLPEFSPLVKEIHSHSIIFLKELGYTHAEFFISSMWANISHKGDYLFPHVHKDSVISGVFYVKSDSLNKIKFFNTPDDMLPLPQQFNELNYKFCEYDCNPGRLLMFRSDFKHGTESQLGDEKIAISFNIKFKS